MTHPASNPLLKTAYFFFAIVFSVVVTSMAYNIGRLPFDAPLQLLVSGHRVPAGAIAGSFLTAAFIAAYIVLPTFRKLSGESQPAIKRFILFMVLCSVGAVGISFLLVVCITVSSLVLAILDIPEVVLIVRHQIHLPYSLGIALTASVIGGTSCRYFIAKKIDRLALKDPGSGT